MLCSVDLLCRSLLAVRAQSNNCPFGVNNMIELKHIAATSDDVNIYRYLTNTAKYLGLTLDAKLRWKAHVKKKREERRLKYKKMYWLVGRRSALSMHNKLMLYKQISKPVWTCGIQLWGYTKQSNTDIIQQFQNKVLRYIVDAPWCIRNVDLHRDFKCRWLRMKLESSLRSVKKGCSTTSTSKRSSCSTAVN